ncbi:MAG: hypothetical protein QNJ23_10610 [Woeseiaceae bacterium]|nr:hypothetical protein [Woeseiaceae bacterium]
MRYKLAGLFVVFLLSASAGSSPGDIDWTPGSTAELVTKADGTYELLRNGEPYFVKGACRGTGDGLIPGDLETIAAYGGNSIRTFGIEQLDEQVDGKPLLDRAHELGISVMVGFWVQHPRHGFDYGDAASVEVQRSKLRDAVLKYRDHPALLAWGLGNEMEAFMPGEIDVRIWQELNHLAGIIKDLDPYHPVVTVVADVDTPKIDGIKTHYPNLDILGVNSYGGAGSVGMRLRDSGWTGPYLLTEYGVHGPWEVATTSWGAPIEADPSTKALETYATYKTDRDNNIGRSLGSHVFYWGHKQEATETWFGMFSPSGEKGPRVDAMAYAWSGEWPSNRAPKLESLDAPFAMQKVEAGATSEASVDCVDREGDDLTYSWDIRAESTDRRVGGDAEAAPPSFPEAIQEGQGSARILIKAPSQPGPYRVFVTCSDGKGGATTHNVPFFVTD